MVTERLAFLSQGMNTVSKKVCKHLPLRAVVLLHYLLNIYIQSDYVQGIKVDIQQSLIVAVNVF